ncbi:hypothetical protein [Hymenobacter psoromatis]|uniref:hypothetical protein n=2 Tax=Hymenobacter psoromatis TaxID=1484116 RepID=UPI001CC0CDB2|nr:hypothetical protein [Hymenobacter psoromatis]
MARQVYIFHKRGNLFYLEMSLLGFGTGYAALFGLHWHWLWSGLAAIVVPLVVAYLFVSYRVVMYVLSVVLSLGWGAMVYYVAQAFAHASTLVSGLLGALTIGLSLWSHKSTYNAQQDNSIEVLREL